MKNFYKILFLLLFAFFINIQNVKASDLSRIINDSNLDKTSVISVSVKDVATGKSLFEYNEQKLLHPASTLKVFTTFPALDVLGSKYFFKTTFYTYNNDLYIKLGADPFLTSLNIKDVVKAIKAQGYKSFNNIYIDDSIMDNVEWGVGWMWDDGTNPLMQKFSSYNIDNNIVNIMVTKDENGCPIVSSPTIFPVSVINEVKAGNSNKVYAIRRDWLSPDIVCLSGTVLNSANVKLPINNMKRYFEKVLFSYLSRSNIKITNKVCLNSYIPENAKEISAISHPASSAIGSILKSSDNRCAETLAKIAGGVKTNSQATLANQISVFYDFWKKYGVDTSNIVVADASGVSRNNLITTDFMTEALNKLYELNGFDKMKAYLAQPGEGTLSDRMLNYRGRLYLKTGTLSNISGITGYVIADNGKIYSVAILIQNFVYPSKQVKIYENQLLESIMKM